MFVHDPRASSTLCYLFALLVIPACGGESGSGTDVDVAVLELRNELRIGSPDDPEYAFGWFRALSVGPEGHVYTLHPESQLVRVHDETGRLVRTIGGKGEGPGEFSNASVLGFLSDTLWVFDHGTYRISYFDAETGELIESVQAPVDLGDGSGEDPPRPSGLLPDGTMLARSMAWSRQVASGEITETVMFRWTRDGELIDTLAVIPLANTTWEVSPPGGGFWSYQSQPFADAELVSLSPSLPEIVHVDRSPPSPESKPTFHVTKSTFAGDTVFRRSFPYEPVPLDAAVVDSVVRIRAEGMSERTDYSRGEVSTWAGETLYTPDLLPPVEAVVVGMDGAVWLQLTDDGKGPLEWLGLAPDGATLGAVEAPRAFRLIAATADRWWGSATDDLDIPYIVRYDIAPATIETELSE